MSEVVSDCCGAPVSAGTKKEFPLGGSTWYETLKVDVCDQCDRECDSKEVEEELV